MSLMIGIRKYFSIFLTVLQKNTSFYANYKDLKGSKLLEEFKPATILTDDIESIPVNDY
jgi:hypothetical protein